MLTMHDDDFDGQEAPSCLYGSPLGLQRGVQSAALHAHWWSSSRIVALFVFVQCLLYLDRGIIPGATNGITTFIMRTAGTNSPSFHLGILQSAFIGGMSLSAPIFAHLSGRGSSSLMAIGLLIWVLAVMASGIAGLASSYKLLLFARAASGIGEASFVCIAPPMLLDVLSPQSKGKGIALFYAMIPLGTALGNGIGAVLGESRYGWPSAYFIECLVALPLPALLAALPDKGHHIYCTSVPHGAHNDSSSRQPSLAKQLMPHGKVLSAEHERTNMNHSTSSLARGMSLDLLIVSEKGTECIDGHAQLPIHPQHVTLEQGKLHENEKTSKVCSDNILLKTNGASCRHVMLSSETDRHVWTENSPAVTLLTDCTNIGSHESEALDTETQKSFVDKVKAVFAPACFRWLVVANACYTASLIAMATFGPSFLTGLDFVQRESLAGITMGLIAASAGIMGSLLGGLIVDQKESAAEREISKLSETHDEIFGDRARRPLYEVDGMSSDAVYPLSSDGSNHQDCGVDWSAICDGASRNHHKNSSSRSVSPRDFWQCDSSTVRPTIHAEMNSGSAAVAFAATRTPYVGTLLRLDAVHRDKCERLTKIIHCMEAVMPFSISGAVILMFTVLAASTFGFISVLVIGLTLIFSCQAALTISAMSAVPDDCRSFCNATLTLALHLFGDVPSPIVIGWLKDYLAPHCCVDYKKEMFDLCRQESRGLRTVVFVTVLWMLGLVVGISGAKRAALHELKKLTHTHAQRFGGLVNVTHERSNSGYSPVID